MTDVPEAAPDPGPGTSPEGGPDAVPFLDLPRDHAPFEDELEEAVLEVVRSGRYALGREVERFEDRMASCLGAGYAVGVASGTDALLLILRALDIGRGDEVITTPFSFFATAGAIAHAGATPVFADILPDTFDLDPEAAAAAVTSRTAALLPVHLFGQMADVDAFRSLAARKGLALVEDAAQAIGAAQNPAGPESPPEPGPRAEDAVRAGAAGDAAALSFYPTKNLGGLGDGGLVTTDDRGLAERVRRLRLHGRERDDYRHREVGYNSRLDAIQAAALGVKLDRVEGWTERRRAHARAYDRDLRGMEGLSTPRVRPGNRHVFHQYTLRCVAREAALRSLERHRIGHGVFYPVPLHLQEAFADLGYGRGAFPEAERAAEEVLSLPVFPSLEEGERRRVVKALEDAARG